MLACKQQLILKNKKLGRKKSCKITKIDSSNFEREIVYDIENEDDREELIRFIDLILKENIERNLLEYNTIRNLEVMKYLILTENSSILSSYWLSSADFSAIMELCGVGNNFALFRGFQKIDYSYIEDLKERKRRIMASEKGKTFIQKCADKGYLWLLDDVTHCFSYAEIASRIQHTTIVHHGNHSWLQPGVSVADLEKLFQELVTLICDVYTNPDMDHNSIIKLRHNKSIERGILVTPRLVPIIDVEEEKEKRFVN
jgi:hypothetical protein